MFSNAAKYTMLVIAAFWLLVFILKPNNEDPIQHIIVSDAILDSIVTPKVNNAVSTLFPSADGKMIGPISVSVTNPENLPRWFQFVQEGMIALSALFTAVFAGFGFLSWRKRKIAEWAFEKREKLLSAVYLAEDLIKELRNPLITSSEIINSFSQDNQAQIDESLKSAYKKDAVVYKARWERLAGQLKKVQFSLHGARVIWGSEIKTVISPLFALIRKLNLTIINHLTSIQEREENNYDIFDKPEREEIFKILYNMGTDEEPDEFQKKLTNAITELEEFIKKSSPKL